MLVIIARWFEERKIMPTYREIAENRGCQVRAVAQATEGLWKKGLLRWSGEARGFKFTPAGEAVLAEVERY